jgi:16S rRNA (uracil1498-N3)-methyltransferase
MPSFYTPHLKENDKKLNISGEEFHHISHVFRKRIDDEISFTSGTGLLAKGKISKISKKELEVEILLIKQEKISFPSVSVAFPLLRNKHDFVIIEKLTELGIKEFFPIITNRSVRTPSANTISKFEKTAIAAIKQCDNAFLPKINNVQKLSELLQNLEDYQPLAALETGKHQTLFELANCYPDHSICLIIGPEGGFDEEEIVYFEERNVPSFTLGNHILRAETATIAAAAQLLSFHLQQNSEYY